MVRRFTEDLISDEKRLVRGEQLLKARYLLRIRDQVHNKPWRVMILAGDKPSEEINAVKELMPRAHIVAADQHSENLLLARKSGADKTVLCNLEDVIKVPRGLNTRIEPPAALMSGGRYDIVVLDLCANVNKKSQLLASVYNRAVTTNGVFIFNFSYGRDVAEVFNHLMQTSKFKVEAERLEEAGIPRAIAGRLIYIFNHGLLNRMVSVMSYRGSTMPMCSVLFHCIASNGCAPMGKAALSYVACTPGDFELAVTCPDPSNLYACPRERIESLRRSHAAIKASYTSKAKRL